VTAGRYSLELHTRVYDDDEGHYLRVGEDAEGLDCVRLCTEGASKGYFGKLELTVPPDLALKLAEALTQVANHIKQRKT
jgi:hypothetical protein